MLKASALYIVIIAAVVISIFCASLIAAGLFYRLEDQKNLRFQRLSNNLESGTALVLSSVFVAGAPQSLDLFSNSTDSVTVQKTFWGLFDVGTVEAYQQSDTLKRAFLSAWQVISPATALYMTDEDRPLSVSGDTRISGNAILPKSGIRRAFVNERAYSGTEMIYGNVSASGRDLPSLRSARLQVLNGLSEQSGASLPVPDSVNRSFFLPTVHFFLNSDQRVLRNKRIAGNVIIHSDTIVYISKSCKINQAIVCAPAIIVEDGFEGSTQFVARDSVVIGAGCTFKYPSAVCVLKPAGGKIQSRIQLGERSTFSGILFTYEKTRSDLQTIISMAKGSKVTGELFSTGYFKFEGSVAIYGKLSCKRLIMQTPSTLYENYLVDVSIDPRKRSRHYLTSSLFSDATGPEKILQWLR